MARGLNCRHRGLSEISGLRGGFIRFFSPVILSKTSVGAGRLVPLPAVPERSDFDDRHVKAVALCSRQAYLFF